MPDRVPTDLKSFSALQPPDTSGRVALTVCTATIVNLKAGTDSLVLSVEWNRALLLCVPDAEKSEEKKMSLFFLPGSTAFQPSNQGSAVEDAWIISTSRRRSFVSRWDVRETSLLWFDDCLRRATGSVAGKVPILAFRYFLLRSIKNESHATNRTSRNYDYYTAPLTPYDTFE